MITGTKTQLKEDFLKEWTGFIFTTKRRNQNWNLQNDKIIYIVMATPH